MLYLPLKAKLATMHYMLCAPRLKNKAYLQQFIMKCYDK